MCVTGNIFPLQSYTRIYWQKGDLDTPGEMNSRCCVNRWWRYQWLNCASFNCFTVQSLKFHLIQKWLWKKPPHKNRKKKKKRTEAIMQHPSYSQDKNSEQPVNSNCNIDYSQQNSWKEKSIIQLEKTMCNY